jgi:hypothetical protein
MPDAEIAKPAAPPSARPHLITSDAEAIEVARGLAVEFAVQASRRDSERLLPWDELDRFVQSGLWGITVPKEFGGAGVSNVTLATVIAIIGAADGSLSQIPQNHFYSLEVLRVGASGLMQLMPATAQWVAKKAGLKDWRWSRVTDVDTNVSLGTWYLRHVLDTLDGQPVLASAAYNAGPGRARAWRPGTSIEGAIYAETIPFNETRDYVKKVMSNTVYYAAIYGGDTRPLKSRLGTIPPRHGGEGYAPTITGQATVLQ